MPFVAIICGATRDKAIELARKARAENAHPIDVGTYHGFMEALRMVYDSETTGMLVMDIDCALDGDEMYTETLPHLVVNDRKDPQP